MLAAIGLILYLAAFWVGASPLMTSRRPDPDAIGKGGYVVNSTPDGLVFAERGGAPWLVVPAALLVGLLSLIPLHLADEVPSLTPVAVVATGITFSIGLLLGTTLARTWRPTQLVVDEAAGEVRLGEVRVCGLQECLGTTIETRKDTDGDAQHHLHLWYTAHGIRNERRLWSSSSRSELVELSADVLELLGPVLAARRREREEASAAVPPDDRQMELDQLRQRMLSVSADESTS
jgi:hypothetical protein